MTEERCTRHPAVAAEYGIATHFIYDREAWRSVIRTDQVLGPLCGDCRLELIRWTTTRATN